MEGIVAFLERAGACSIAAVCVAMLGVAMLGVAMLGVASLAPAGTQAAATPQPTVGTGGVTSLTPTSAILLGSLNAKAEPVNYRFQYGTTKAYGIQTALQPGGRSGATIHVNQPVGELAPNTVYHYRLVAYGARGAVLGGDRSFKTPKVPLSLGVAGSPSPVPYGDTLVVGGTLNGTGHGGRGVALQANPFPYTQGFQQVGNPELTSSTGGFSFPVLGLSTNTQFRVVTTAAPFVVSPVFLEGVAIRVSLRARRVRRNRPGRYYRLSGTVAPAEVGAEVGFQLLRPGRSSLNVGGTFVHSATPTVSSFSTIVRVRRRGVYDALVKIDDGSHVSAYSEPIRLG